MKRTAQNCSLLLALAALLLSGPNMATANDGKEAFETHCSGCHPQGKNPQNPAKTLFQMDRQANGIKNATDIIRIMRKPGPGMKQFTQKDISDRTAQAIASYIIATFR